MPDEFHHPNDKSTTWGLLDLQDGEDVEETLRKPEAKHFRLRGSFHVLFLFFSVSKLIRLVDMDRVRRRHDKILLQSFLRRTIRRSSSKLWV